VAYVWFAGGHRQLHAPGTTASSCSTSFLSPMPTPSPAHMVISIQYIKMRMLSIERSIISFEQICVAYHPCRWLSQISLVEIQICVTCSCQANVPLHGYVAVAVRLCACAPVHLCACAPVRLCACAAVCGCACICDGARCCFCQGLWTHMAQPYGHDTMGCKNTAQVI